MPALGTETGSVMNHLMGGTVGAPEPEVGMGATRLMWTDRTAGTIIEVTLAKSGARKGLPSRIVWQADKATRDDSNGMSDAQSYTYEPNPHATKIVHTWRAGNRWYAEGDSSKGTQLRIGSRDEYYDYSF